MSARFTSRDGAGLALVVVLCGWLVYSLRAAPRSYVARSTTDATPSSPTITAPTPDDGHVELPRARSVSAHDAAARVRRRVGVIAHGGWGSGPGEFGRASAHESNPEIPMALCVGAAGEVTVLDQVNRRAQRFRDGNLVATLSLRSGASQDIAALPGGRTAVLDRLGQPGVEVFDPDGSLAQTLPLTGGPIREGGGVTGLFSDASGVYAEWAHGELVQLSDADGQIATDQELLAGRPSRDGRLLLRAAITDRAGGVVTVTATARQPDASSWTQPVRFGAAVLFVVLLDSDREGRVYVGADIGTSSDDPPYATVGEAVSVVRLSAEGAPSGSIELPPLPPADETFRPLAVDDEGTVYMLVPGPDGLDVVAGSFDG